MRAQAWTLGAALMLASATALADPAAEAKALGAAAATTIGGTLSTTPAEEMTPGYTTTLPQSNLTADDLRPGADAQALACDALPAASRGPECEAILGGLADAQFRSTQPGMLSDPAVQAALSATRSVTLDGLTGTYTACTVDDVARGIVTKDVQYCHNYFKRVLDESCTKTLQIDVNWFCPSGATGPFVSGDYRYCEHLETTTEPACLETEALVGGYCRDYWTDVPRTPDQVQVTNTVQTPADADITEWWDNPCMPWEARVPLELQWPDGYNPPAEVDYLGHSPTGRRDKCARTNSVCSDIHPQTRIIEGIPFTHACWAYTNTFDCVSLDDVSDCQQPRWGACTTRGTPECIDKDVDGFCTAERLDFDCTVRDTRRVEQEINCENRVFVDREGTNWDASHPKDEDFLTVITYMEAGREAGRYLDKDSMTLFNGVDNRCVKKLFGLVNCCNRAGVDAQMFNNLSIAMGVAGSVGKAMVSTYMFDALLAIDSPTFVINGFGSLFGMGVSSPLAGFLLGQVGVTEFIGSLVPGPWTIAMMAIQYSGLLSCKESEQMLALKRDSDLCVDKGNYCSRKIRFIGTCLERTYTHCCFNSRLAKLIHTQGQAQLGISSGTARAPNCGGFSPDQLQNLDLSRMDLTEFMDEIRAAAVEMPLDIGATISTCILGGGAC